LILIGATQASIYGVLRVTFTLYGNQLTSTLKQIGNASVTLNWILGIIIVALALITIVIGVLMALKQTDFKRMIAFAAVGEIGYIFLAIGSVIISYGQIIANGNMDLTGPAGMALQGGIFHIINDALDVGLLFLVAGAIYYATKQTSLNEMGGLARNMKYTTVFFIIGLLAVAGMPPMNGFASKLLIYQSTYLINPIIAIVAIVFSILLLAVFVKVFHSAFLGPKLPKFNDVKEAPKSMLIAMGVIAFIIIFFGLFPNLVVENIIQPAAKAIIDHSSYITTVMGGVLP
jgi:multicomponent Na+:H+ antiporter subunit D